MQLALNSLMRVLASSDPFIRKYGVSAKSLLACFVGPDRPIHSAMRISALAQNERAGVSWSLLKRLLFGWRQFKLAYDGFD